MKKSKDTVLGDSAPRVLVIAPQPFFEWRGSPIRVSFLVRGLAELGYKVDLLCMPVGKPFSCSGVSIYRPWNIFRVNTIPIGPSLRKALFDILIFAKAVSLVFRHRYVAIHGIEDAGIFAVILGKASGAKIVFEKHSDPFSYRGSFLRNVFLNVYAAVERLTIRCSNSVIATGLGLVAQAQKAAPNKSIHYIFDIPSSTTLAEPKRIKAARLEWQRSPEELLVTYAGSFAVYQGIDLMFAAMPKVVQACPQVRFIIVGGEPDEVAERKNWLRKEGIEAFVRFVGKIPPDDLPHYLAASDILLSPRIAGHNSPLKILDYLATGKAIVAVDSVANRLLLDEKTALITEATPEEYASGIIRLLQDSVLRLELGAKGQSLINQVYNYEEFKKRLDVCYEQLLASNSASAAIIRDVRGNISAWDGGAERIYGWSASQALGNISHQLLKTEFPKALQEINAELENRHLWEGELIHTTCDGEKIKVRSCWQRVKASKNDCHIIEVNRIIPSNSDENGVFSAKILKCLLACLDLPVTAYLPFSLSSEFSNCGSNCD